MSILDCFKSKYIALDIQDELICAYELGNGIIYSESIKTNSMFNNHIVLGEIVQTILEKTKAKIIKPYLYVAVPHEYNNIEWKQKFLSCAGENWRKILYIDSFLCVGASIDSLDEYTKKILVYVKRNRIYVGVMFAGGAYYIESVEYGYESTEIFDLERQIDNIINSNSMEMPDDFRHVRIDKIEFEKLEKGWKSDFYNEIFVYHSKGSSEIFKSNKYRLKYLDDCKLILDSLIKYIEVNKNANFIKAQK